MTSFEWLSVWKQYLANIVLQPSVILKLETVERSVVKNMTQIYNDSVVIIRRYLKPLLKRFGSSLHDSLIE